MEFTDLRDRLLKKSPEREEEAHSRILAFDPGHTTGWAFFHHGELNNHGQIDTTSIEACVRHAPILFADYKPHVVVIEDYRIYKWRQKQHVGSDMLTTRVIGCLETLCVMDFVPHIVKQPAQVAKGFCDDKKMREWGYWMKGERHARDAIRHGCYFLLFGAVRKCDKGTDTTTIMD